MEFNLRVVVKAGVLLQRKIQMEEVALGGEATATTERLPRRQDKPGPRKGRMQVTTTTETMREGTVEEQDRTLIRGKRGLGRNKKG